MTLIVGLDIGTTSAKAVAFGLSRPWRRVAIREYPLLQPQPGWQVQDPEAVLDATAEALAECVAATNGAEVIAVSLSTAMHGLVGVDAQLRPLTPLITWADARAREEARALHGSGEAAELHRRGGAPVHPMTPLVKLIWLRRHEPQLFASARWWLGLKDFLLARLTGTVATELSSASGTGLLDLASRGWSPRALELAGLAPDRLPEILPTTAVLELAPEPARRVGLPAGTPVVAGAGDGALGNLGTRAMDPGVAGLSLGTSGAIRTVVGEPRVDDAGALFCYALTDAAWVVGGAVSNGGIVARWAARALAEDASDEAVFELAATAPPGCDGLVMLPYLLAERAPLWDADLPGAYLGLRRDHGRAHLVRAAIEGVALQLRVILDQLDRLHPIGSVRATGGALRSPLWCEVLAAALDRPLHVVGDAEGTALGAAALGLFALGRAPGLAEAVTALTGPEADAAAALVADPALVAVYARTRAAVPALIEALAPVARLFGRGEVG